MIWVKLLESLVLGIVRGVLGLKKTDDARQLGETLGSHIGDDILKRGVHPSARPPPLPDAQPLSAKDVRHQQDQIRSAARAFPVFTSGLPPASPLPPARPRPSAIPPPIMPAPIRPPRKR